ncbi:hypothetical protein VKT23_018501 [Stygiomarasmius scandens]|uniref:Uncharacterized protein n=1 Tax=Marasmiellus scandens TaxID=2682957 RepID=A0ABR1INY7_9AGAR
MWDTVVKYLQEVEKLDAEKGRMGALDKRDELILAVKKIVEASTRNVEDQITRANRLRFGKQILETHQDFMGTEIQLVGDLRVMDKLIPILVTKDDIKYSLIRFASQQRDLLPGWKALDYYNDLINCFRAADEDKINLLPQNIVNLITHLNRLDEYCDKYKHFTTFTNL